MNIGFYFAVVVGMLLLVSQHTSAHLLSSSSGMEIFEKDRITLCRVVAAVMIVVGHSQMKLTANPNYPALLEKINVGSYWVAVFFLLSGYGVIYSVHNKKDYLHKFVSKHLIQILVPYVTAHIIYYPIKMMCGVQFTTQQLLWSIFGKGYIVDFSWYPIVIICLYLLFYVIWSLKLREVWKVALLMLGNVVITFALSFIFKGLEWWYLSTLAFGAGAGLYYLLQRFNINAATLLWSGLLIAVCGGVFMIPLCHRIFGAGMQHFYYIFSHNLSRIGMAVAVITALSAAFPKTGKTVHALGSISYEIYLMHGLAIFIMITWGLSEKAWLFLAAVLVSSLLFAKIMNSINRKLEHCIKQRN